VANLPDGNIIFGTTTGSVVIRPQDIQPLSYTAKLHLMRVILSKDQDEAVNDRMHKMLSEGKLQLGYQERTFDLYFESVNMRNHYDIVYRYQVGKGDWSRPTDEQYIRFTNLEPGKHQLTLQCVSRTSGVVIDSLQLTIVIARPWWNSWWMWCIYVALVVLAFYAAWRVYQLHAKYMRVVLSSPSVMGDSVEKVVSEELSPSADGTEAPEVVNEAESQAFIEKVTRIVAENLSDTEFNIDRLCREMAMSRTLFYIKLKSFTGKSPQDFIRVIRLERAASLLRSGRSVADTATVTGFDNAKYFSTVFKKYFGVSPSKYC
jgi:AraC-like DNA-binding protein